MNMKLNYMCATKVHYKCTLTQNEVQQLAMRGVYAISASK